MRLRGVFAPSPGLHRDSAFVFTLVQNQSRQPMASGSLLVAEPYAAEPGLLGSRLDVGVLPRADDYELTFPASWLGHGTPIAGLPPHLALDALAAYRDRPLPAQMAEALLVALEPHPDLPSCGIGVTSAEIGLPSHAATCAEARGRELPRDRPRTANATGAAASGDDRKAPRGSRAARRLFRQRGKSALPMPRPAFGLRDGCANGAIHESLAAFEALPDPTCPDREFGSSVLSNTLN